MPPAFTYTCSRGVGLAVSHEHLNLKPSSLFRSRFFFIIIRWMVFHGRAGGRRRGVATLHCIPYHDRPGEGWYQRKGEGGREENLKFPGQGNRARVYIYTCLYLWTGGTEGDSNTDLDSDSVDPVMRCGCRCDSPVWAGGPNFPNEPHRSDM